jgi:hypothetical protein
MGSVQQEQTLVKINSAMYNALKNKKDYRVIYDGDEEYLINAKYKTLKIANNGR